jgi:L-aminopeptidase/D-esterase-like protein
MRSGVRTFGCLREVAAVFGAIFLVVPGPARPEGPDDQSGLIPLLNHGGNELRFDWPILSIGTGEYAEGPTGVTVFRFARKVTAVLDVRGEPGAANTEFLRLGRDNPIIDAIVLSGGSAYGLESTTAVMTALKDDHVRTGVLGDIGLVSGAIIMDLGDRRLNEVYPDKRLAQAAFRAAQPGVFRTGPAGAGRMAMTGFIVGCRTHSGQGGAFFEHGDLKIAAFTVVNALGLVTDRAGRVQVPCNATGLKGLSTAEVLARVRTLAPGGHAHVQPSANTTISLVVVNQKMSYADLQRLAIQVHTSMARGLQPYATVYDGDILFAVSTNELELPKDARKQQELLTLIPIVASELMWDAILTAQPEPPGAPEPVTAQMPMPTKHAGTYRFSRFVTVEVTARDGKLFARASGERPAYDIGKEPGELVPVSTSLDRFTLKPVPQEPLVLEFTEGTLVINPGPWAQRGERVRSSCASSASMARR